MDFNTGSRPGSESGSGGSGGGTGSRTPGTSASSGGEFDYRDPVQSFIRTVVEVVTRPAAFFGGIRREGDFANPILFAVICAVISGVLGGILRLLFDLGSNAGAGSALLGLIGTIILTPIFTVIGLFIGAGILHILVLLLVRPNAGFEATLRVVSYSSVTQLVSWLSAIPVLGALVTLVVSVYGIYLGIVGMREVHSTTTGRAAAVVLIPAVIVLVIVLLLILIIGVVIFSALNNG